MKHYSHYGVNDFILCLGYRGFMIKEYFANYFLHTSDVTIDINENRMHVHKCHGEPWRITLVDTGDETETGGRLRRVRQHLDDEDDFCFTYGDGVSDVPIDELIRFHRESGSLATLTAVQPPGRFGALSLDRTKILSFQEKPQGDSSWINGGYFVLSKGAIDYVENDATIWERQPLERIAQAGMLSAYLHNGFWQSMDTLRDKILLDELWSRGAAPWRSW
jgi:glucose-1-phosphate cytidylyltransferase